MPRLARMLTVCALLAALPGYAATWTLLTAGNATGAWNTSGNWTGGVPNATGATADFSTLNLTANSTVTLATPVTVGALVFADATTSSNTWTLTGSTLTLAASSGAPAITVTNQTATLSSILAGTAGFIKSGAGTLTLAGGASNALTGAITVNAGTLKIIDGYSHAGVSGPITVASGATFQFSQNFIPANPLPNALTLSGTGYTGAAFGALNLFGNVTASGPVTLAGDTTITHDFNNATISNTISGAGKNLQLTTLTAGQPGLVISGSIQTGSGALAVTGAANASGSGSVTTYSVKLSGANTFTGGVTIHNGTLLLAGAGALNATPGSENAVTFGAGTTTGNLTLGGNSVVVANLTSDASTPGSPVVQNAATTAATLTIGNAQNLGGTFAGIIQDGAPSTGVATALSLKKSGTGTLLLSGANTYTGTTTFAGGALAIDNPASLGSGGPLSFAGGTLKYAYTPATEVLSARFSTAAGQAYAIDTNGLDLTYATALASTGGSLTKSGAGILTLAVSGTGGTATKLSGGITVSGGRLAIGDGYSHVNSTGGAITVAAGATFYYSQNFISANPLTNPLTLSGDGDGAGTYGALELRGNATASGAITLAADATISHSYNNATVSGGITGANKNLTLASTVTGQGALIVNGNISLGTGVLTKTWVNAVRLGGVNSYASAVVSAGLLNFTANSALGGSGANILVESGGSVTGGDLTLLLTRIHPASSGALALAGGTYATALDLSSLPALRVGASASTTLTSPLLPGGGAFRFGGGGAVLTVNSALSGANGLWIDGGSVVLGGTHDYSGATTVNGGSLQADGILNGAVTVSVAGTLSPGPASAIGSLTLLSPVAVAGTLSFRIDRSAAQTADLLNAPSLSLSGTLKVTNSGSALQAGDTFKLFNISGAFTQTNATLNLPALNAGLAWDYSALLTTGTLRVVTFSSVGDPAWPHLLVDEFQAALTAGYSTITIAPGTYLLPDLPNYKSSFPISGKSNLSILADNVVLLVGKQRTFSLSDCSNVTLRGVTIRARYPSFTQGRIQSKGTNADGTPYARWRISDGYPATFATDSTYASTSTRFRAGSSFNAINQTTCTIDLSTGDNYDSIVTDEGGGVWKVDFPARTSLPCQVNDWLVTRLPTDDSKGYAVYLKNCTDCTLQSVTSQGGGFATFYELEGGNNHLLGCRIECSPDAPSGGTELPVVSCAADGVHSRHASTGIHVEDCVFSGALLDDCIAIHGQFRTVLSVSGNTVTYDDGDNDPATVATAGKFVIGRPVRISATNGFFAQTTCTNHEDLCNGTFRLTLADTWTIPVGARISNPDYNGGTYRIINNQLGGTRSRAIIVKGDNGLISGNTIKNSGIAVNVGPEYYWEESDYCWNTTITGNVLEGCRTGVNFVSDGAYGNKTVTITNNVFGTMLSGDAISLRGCRDVVVSGNFFGPLVNGNALDLATVNTISLANNLVEYIGTVQNRIARDSSTVTFLTGLNNGVLFAGRNTALTNTSASFMLSALNYEWGSGGYHQILSATTGQALGVGASTSSGAGVGLEAANGSDGQLWRLSPYGTADADTTLTLVNKLSGLTVTVSGGKLVQQAAATGSTGQIWTPSFPADYVYATWAASTGAGTTVTADNDGDGLANLMEYALATNPLAAGPGPAVSTAALTVNGTPASYLTITFVRRVAASDLTLAVEYSNDLATWSSSAVLVASVPASDGTTTETWRAPTPVGTAARDFLRVRVTKP